MKTKDTRGVLMFVSATVKEELRAILWCLFESVGNSPDDASLLASRVVDKSIAVEGTLMFCLCSSPAVEPYCIKCECGAPTKWFAEYQLKLNA